MTYWKSGATAWALIALIAAAVLYLYFDAVSVMVTWWSDREEYSHGFLIPAITIYLIWQRSDRLREMKFESSWLGVGCALLGIALYVIGELSTIYAVIQYGFVLFIIGAVWAWVGTPAFRVIAIPLVLLFFMVPFPNFIYNGLSSNLQLLSSQIGVYVIRMFGIGVFLEGNVIDLGTFKLQVVEACNGLRYLFPLMTLGVIVGYFYHAALWKRVLVFLSTIPITILMNSFRIGVIGVMVEYWGQSMAEGFLHDFEGWAIFMACFGILFVEMWLLMRLSRDRRPLSEVFGVDPPIPAAADAIWVTRALPASAKGLLLLVLVAVIPAQAIPNRVETLPERVAFSAWPLEFAGWSGRAEPLEDIYLDALKLTDYVMVNYRQDGDGSGGGLVNFYVAYYESQKKGQSAHSPKSCLPGGGWVMESLTSYDVPETAVVGVPLRVNRTLITQGDSRQLVYYWFQQRGRVLTNEYLVKWFVFWDALTRNRTDGALVRLIIALPPGQDEAVADATLGAFAADMITQLPRYLPN